jgi:hypothetical protein
MEDQEIWQVITYLRTIEESKRRRQTGNASREAALFYSAAFVRSVT